VRKSEALHAATTLASPQSLLGSPSLEVPSLPGGGRAFPSTLTELLLLPDDGFSKPQSPFFSLTQKRVVNPKSLISKDPFFFFLTLKKENKKKKSRGEILRKTPPQQTE
jgi:hypothetical protein